MADDASLEVAGKIQVALGIQTDTMELQDKLAAIVAAGKAGLVEAAVAVVSTVPGGTLHARALDGLLVALVRHREE